MGKKCEECKKGAPAWMTTFSDMTTLLLTFFILLLSMATLDKRKVQMAFGSLEGSMGILKEGRSTNIGRDQIIPQLMMAKTTSQTQRSTAQSLRNYVQQASLAQMISVVRTKKGISVRIMDSVLFRPGSADLLPEAKPILEKLAAVIADAPYHVNIEGHTDNVPIRTPKFPSNWELSTERAVTIVRHFIDLGINPERLSATGYAEYHQLLPNITPENRAKNRRVEINFVSPEFAEANKNIFEDEDGGQ